MRLVCECLAESMSIAPKLVRVSYTCLKEKTTIILSLVKCILTKKGLKHDHMHYKSKLGLN